MTEQDMKWYIVHVYSMYEEKAKLYLRERIESLGKEGLFGEILIPSETVVEVKKGVKRTSQRQYFPGYIFVQMILNDQTWHLVKNTNKVTGFVGGGKMPAPVSEEEVRRIAQQVDEGTLRPQPKDEFEVGEQVRVSEGPFVNFSGSVDTVNPEKGTLKVLVSIFGRSTPIELDFMQVEKVS